jgi:hypothetical protein
MFFELPQLFADSCGEVADSCSGGGGSSVKNNLYKSID